MQLYTGPFARNMAKRKLKAITDKRKTDAGPQKLNNGKRQNDRAADPPVAKCNNTAADPLLVDCKRKDDTFADPLLVDCKCKDDILLAADPQKVTDCNPKDDTAANPQRMNDFKSRGDIDSTNLQAAKQKEGSDLDLDEKWRILVLIPARFDDKLVLTKNMWVAYEVCMYVGNRVKHSILCKIISTGS